MGFSYWLDRVVLLDILILFIFYFAPVLAFNASWILAVGHCINFPVTVIKHLTKAA